MDSTGYSHTLIFISNRGEAVHRPLHANLSVNNILLKGFILDVNGWVLYHQSRDVEVFKNK